jgi:glycosyltransferase involved in cell wall biosynthesis
MMYQDEIKLQATRLVVNTRFSTRQLTGVERYASEIVRRLGREIRTVHPSTKLPAGLGHIWEQLVLPFLIKSDELLWSPANTGPIILSKQVLTIHDLSWLEHPQGFTPIFTLWYRWLLPKLIQSVKYVLTPSRYIKLRIIDRFQISQKKVIVVPGGVDRGIFAPVKDAQQILQPFSLPERFILYVGSQGRRKNLVGLGRAWARLGQLFPADVQELYLVLVGAGGRPFRKVNLPTYPGVIYLGYVPDIFLPALYSAALAFINPSFYEGFGLTTLEAMACGTAVISSRAGALPEVAGGAALYFDPLVEEEFVECIHRIVTDSDLRIELKRSGLRRAAQFSWDNSAVRVLDILQRAAD